MTTALAAGASRFQWQSSAEWRSTWTDIAGATTQLFVPTQAQVGLLPARAEVSFVDDGGTLETVFSAPTDIVGDLIIGNNRRHHAQRHAGDDMIFARRRQRHVNGLAGNDILIGGAGNDTLNGGTGDDTMIGGHRQRHLHRRQQLATS